ncbi:MAG: bifunctional glutamate N-acetyltransferase/amino-acid acetyltransferase ArgJ [Actinobacteria bacterium]|nr:bifunctional glutamate N-acetyltransferase/amino-acid acetyltransferase ArgJ [Actinomycetota bacterium]
MRLERFERIMGGVCAPNDFLASGVSCGIKDGEKLDLALVYSETPSVAAGVFTTNNVKAAPVLLTRERVPGSAVRTVVINSGCANALTGKKGMEDAAEMVRTVEDLLGLVEGQALVCSTGHISEYLPMENVVKGIERGVSELSPGGNSDAAKAIMTTDTYPKELAVEIEIGGEMVRLGAMAKGSGMIHPGMATLISIITTDMPLVLDEAQDLLKKAVEWSFNRISVDGAQSTNDTVLMLANGAALTDDYEVSGEEKELFFEALCWLTGNLAMALVKDGEGAAKHIRIVVNGAVDDRSAVEAARAIANSNLVKSAFHGEIPGWGRIAAAAGSADIEFDQDNLDIYIGENKVVSGGEVSSYDSGVIARMLARDEIEITVDLGSGGGSAYFLTTDLSEKYIKINASEKS